MVLIIGTPFSGTGTATTLAAGNNYVLQPDIVVRSFDSAAILGLGSNSFTIHGAVIGASEGIWMGGGSTTLGSRLFIGATGSVSAVMFDAVYCSTGQAEIVNKGLIAGKSFGVSIGSDSGTGSSLFNSGSIIGGRSAVNAGYFERLAISNSGLMESYDDDAIDIGFKPVTLVNTGTINAWASLTTAPSFGTDYVCAYDGGSLVDSVTNRGLMNGHVDLGAGNDVYEGSGGRLAANCWVWGNAGGDSLRGGAAKEIIIGGVGNDTIMGRGGADLLFGDNQLTLVAEAGQDVFVYNAITDSGSSAATRDVIWDFNNGNDKINLLAIDANTGVGGNQAFSLLAKGTAASPVGVGKIGWYWVDNANNSLDRTIIKINNDADAAIEMQIELVGLKWLSGGAGVDFIF